MSSKVVGTFGATGQSSSITVRGSKLVDLSLNFTSDSGVGTVALQRKTNADASGAAVWLTIASYDESSTETEVTIRSAVTREYRLNCTAYTSGSIHYELQAGNKDS